MVDSSVDSSVERFIAVPISATEQYLISSTGQTYITEKLSSPIINRKKELVESSEPGEQLLLASSPGPGSGVG